LRGDDIDGGSGEGDRGTGDREIGVVAVAVDSRDGDNAGVRGGVAHLCSCRLVANPCNEHHVRGFRLGDGLLKAICAAGASKGHANDLRAVAHRPGDALFDLAGDIVMTRNADLNRQHFRLRCDAESAIIYIPAVRRNEGSNSCSVAGIVDPAVVADD
jgi:hypothetical protein